MDLHRSGLAATAATLAGLALSLTPVSTAQASGGGTVRPTLPAHLLRVDFDHQDRSLARGDRFGASGTVTTVDAATGKPLDGVPARFTLAVTDASGRELGTQRITAADDGSFSTQVPGSVSRTLSAGGTLALRALDASYADGGTTWTSTDAGATSVQLAAAATGLRVQDSFVSSVGWVKPGDTYPSRIIVTNPGATPVAGAKVVVTAPAGSTLTGASGPGTHPVTAHSVTWTLPTVPAATGEVPGEATLVLDSKAATPSQLGTIVWRDLSTTATLTAPGTSDTTVRSHGPKVIPPSDAYDSARYGDRPFPVIPVEYRDRAYLAGHDGSDLASKINDPEVEGSTFNLYQEMSLHQLFPHGDVPSDGVATADFTSYAPGFEFTQPDPTTTNTCHGVTKVGPVPAPGTVGGVAYDQRITNGVYNLPGDTDYYGDDANGSAIIGSLGGVAALQQIDSGCGPTGKLVYDAAAISDPEIDYSDYDTDKDGVVDFFMVVFAGCGGNGASQLGACTSDPQDLAPYDNVWPHSSSLEYYYTDPTTGLPGYTTDDQLKDNQDRPLYYTDASRTDMTTTETPYKVFVRIGPYNVNPETAIDKASVISHEYGHSLGLPDFYSTGSRETYGDWNLMATDKSQNMDAFSRQELGWVVPRVLAKGTTTTVDGWTDSKQDTHTIVWQKPDGTPYTLKGGPDGTVHNSLMYVAKLPGRNLLDPAKFDTGDKASATHAWFSGSGNDFGCNTDGQGHNLDFAIPGLADLPSGTTVSLSMKSMFDVEWDYDYGFVLTSTNGGQDWSSHASTRSTPTTTSANPNQNACQAAYGNGITGDSASYTDPVTVNKDRALGNYPDSTFIADSFDVSDLVGADSPVLRLSYATDPGLARPGWFMDDLKVTATLPGGATQDLMVTDFESDGGPSDPRVFNGGCQADNPGGDCTHGWQYVNAGDPAAFDHAYYLEMRDRSGFDDDGHGQIDRDPIGWQPGLYLSYTDEAHGYGNAGTDDPPAQSPLDSTPDPGNETPDLNDAAFTPAAGRASYSDSGEGHTDNYTDPSNSVVDPRYSGVANPWRFQYDCLGFQVLSMSGDDIGPETSDGNLTGSVRFTTGDGCGPFDYGYTTQAPPANTKPTARAKATPSTQVAGRKVTFDGTASTDAQTPDDLDYSWDFGDGGSTKDASGAQVEHAYPTAGTYDATLTVTDPMGKTDTDSVTVTVTDAAGNQAPSARVSVKPRSPYLRRTITLSGAKSTDSETSTDRLRYAWDFHDGGSHVDAHGEQVQTRYGRAGDHQVTLTVTDAGGKQDTTTKSFVVRRAVECMGRHTAYAGSWRHVLDDRAPRGDYCDDLGKGEGRDTMTLHFRGPQLDVSYGKATHGGSAKVLVDGTRVGTLHFSGTHDRIRWGKHEIWKDLGKGRHTMRLVVIRRAAYLNSFITVR